MLYYQSRERKSLVNDANPVHAENTDQLYLSWLQDKKEFLMKSFSIKLNFCFILYWTFNICDGQDEKLKQKEEQVKNFTNVSPTLSYPITDSQSPEVLNARKLHKTDDCFKNPEIQNLDMSSRDLSVVPHGSFDDCHHLYQIILCQNTLTTLPSDIFAYNFYLKSITMSSNNLTSVDPVWFESCALTLEHLDLSNNSLIRLPLARFPKMSNMKRFLFSQNRVVDLDEALIVAKFPQVKHIAFQFNQIGCWRHKALLKYFEDICVSTDSKGFNNVSKKVWFTQSNETGCILEDQWTYLMLTKMRNESYVEPTDLLIVWISFGISIFSIGLSIAILVCIHRKFVDLTPRNNHFQTDFGEYYEAHEESCGQNEPSQQMKVRVGHASYAVVDPNRERK